MSLTLRHVLAAVTALIMLLMAGCGGNDRMPMPPSGPSPALAAIIP
jgi:hypothetical protein